MDYNPESGESELRIYPETDPDNEPSEITPSPRLLRAVERLNLPGNRFQPVGTDNTHISNPCNQPILSNPTKKIQHQTYTNGTTGKSISWPLRFAVEAVLEITLENPNKQTYFITVNFSNKFSKRLKVSEKNAPTAYLNILNERLKKHPRLRDFVLAIEVSNDGSLHAHFVASMTPGDAEDFGNIIKKGASRENNAIKFQTEYRRYHSAKPGTSEHEFLEIDDEYNLSSYPNSDHNGRRYCVTPIDIQIADYLSKDFGERIEGMPGQHWAAPAHIKKRAGELYKAAYEAQKARQQSND